MTLGCVRSRGRSVSRNQPPAAGHGGWGGAGTLAGTFRWAAFPGDVLHPVRGCLHPAACVLCPTLGMVFLIQKRLQLLEKVKDLRVVFTIFDFLSHILEGLNLFYSSFFFLSFILPVVKVFFLSFQVSKIFHLCSAGPFGELSLLQMYS